VNHQNQSAQMMSMMCTQRHYDTTATADTHDYTSRKRAAQASTAHTTVTRLQQKKIVIRSCPVTQHKHARGLRSPPSHPHPHFPLARWSLRLRLAASDSLLRLHRHSAYDELDSGLGLGHRLRMTDPSIVAPLNPSIPPLLPLFRAKNGTHLVYWWCQYTAPAKQRPSTRRTNT
jgi:hypothetical protein